MRKFLFLVIVLGLLAAPFTAIAGTPRCEFMNTQTDPQTSSIITYINPKKVSYIITMRDSKSHGSIYKLIIIVVMNNGDKILYGRYPSESNRDIVRRYITNNISKCNEFPR